jgi:hypothetical protein
LGNLTEDAQAVLDALYAKLEAFQERERELRKALRAMGLEWMLDMEGLPTVPHSLAL